MSCCLRCGNFNLDSHWTKITTATSEGLGKFRVVRSYDYGKANCPRQREHRSCGSTGSRGWAVREPGWSPGWSYAPGWVARTELRRLAARLAWSRALLGYLAPRRRGEACWVDGATLEARTARSVASWHARGSTLLRADRLDHRQELARRRSHWREVHRRRPDLARNGKIGDAQ